MTTEELRAYALGTIADAVRLYPDEMRAGTIAGLARALAKLDGDHPETDTESVEEDIEIMADKLASWVASQSAEPLPKADNLRDAVWLGKSVTALAHAWQALEDLRRVSIWLGMPTGDISRIVAMEDALRYGIAPKLNKMQAEVME